MFDSIFVYLWVFGSRRDVRPDSIPMVFSDQCISAGLPIPFSIVLPYGSYRNPASTSTVASTEIDTNDMWSNTSVTLLNVAYTFSWTMDSAPGTTSCCSLVPIHFVKWIKIKKLMLHTDRNWWTQVISSLFLFSVSLSFFSIAFSPCWLHSLCRFQSIGYWNKFK